MAIARWGRTTAVLFTDIARSTEMMFELGAERYEGVRRRHMTHLHEALREQGGTEVKNLGDGIMAVIPSAAGAVAAAVAMQQRTAGQAAAAGIDLKIRVGVSIGDAIEENADWFGPPVVEAARLCQNAVAGEILVPLILKELAGDRPGHPYELVGLVTLKGIPDQAEVYRVVWAPLEQPAMHLPAMLSGHGRFSMVGRERERETLLEAWRRAREGERRVVLLGGEPGVGKSRLASEVAQTVHALGGRVLLGRCDPEASGPFQPFVLALRQWVDEARALATPIDLGPSASALGRVLPELAEQPGTATAAASVDPAAQQMVLFDAFADAFHRIAATTPTLLIVEDLHWAAPQTVHLLRHIVGWSHEAALMLVGTYRATEADPTSSLGRFVAESSRLHRCERISLDGLDEDSLRELLESARGGAAGEHNDDAERVLAHALHDQTGGNALYATQLLTHLFEQGIEVESFDETTMPESLRDVLHQRVAAAGPEVGRLLELAAVAGERFDPLVLEQIDDLGGAFMDALDQAAAARLVDSVGSGMQYRFVHALVRSTMLDRISGLRRARLHDRLAARLLLTPGAELAGVAYHASQSAMLGRDHAERAVATAIAAGDRAKAALEYGSAAEWYGAALVHLSAAGDDGPARRSELLVLRGEAERAAGLTSFRETLLEAASVARAAGIVETQIRACLANTRGSFASSRGLDDERVEMLRSTLAIVPVEADRNRAKLLSLLAVELCVGPGRAERQALCDEALRLSRESGDAATLAWVLARVDLATQHILTVERRAALQSESMDAADRQPDDFLRLWALQHWIKTGLEIGDVTQVADGIARFEALATKLRQPEPFVWLARAKGTYASVVGDLAAAERSTFEAFTLGRGLALADALPIFAAQLFSIRFLQGRLTDLLEGMTAIKGQNWTPSMWAGWSLLHAEIGDDDEALDSLERQHDLDFRDYPQGHQSTPGLAATALAAARVGDVTVAAQLLPVLDEASGAYFGDACYWYGPVTHHQGILRAIQGDLDAAVVHLSAAVDSERQIGGRAWLVRSLAELSRTYSTRRGHGDTEAARAAAGEASAIADEIGMQGIERLMAVAVRH